MADFFNALGSTIVTGTSARDFFYPFMKDRNFDRLNPDAVMAPLVWNTAILTASGSAYQLVGANVQISTDLLVGAEGTDIVYGSNASDALFYNNGQIAGGFGGFSNIEQFLLGEGDDIIDLSAHGVGGTDYTKAGAIYGQGGNDLIIGGAGKDTLEGDAGNDIIFGWRGSDTLFGGSGDDFLYGDDLGFNGISGDDIIEGGSGSDSLYGGRGSDKLTGGDDNDLLYGQAGGDNLSGGAGDDRLYGDDADTVSNDILNGDAGNDQLYGGAGADELYGGSGDDALEGGLGNDFMHGGGGQDTIIAGAGNDIVDGSADVDTLVFAGNRAEYQFALQPDGSYLVTDLRGGSPEGSKTVRNVEFFAFADITVAITAINYAPVITSNGGGSSAALSIGENEVEVTTVTATDQDAGQTISFAIVGGADAALFAIDPATGGLSFLTAPNFESPTDADGDNVYRVTVAANDGNGGIDTQDLSVTVSDLPDGAAPIITSNGGGVNAAVSVEEGEVAITTVTATDADGPSVGYAIVGGADAALFSIDATTGALSFLSAPDFENPGDQNRDNVYDVVVQASDGSNFDRQTLAVTVGNLNDNQPMMTSFGGAASAAFSVDENGLLAAMIAASDADGTPLTYGIAGGSDAALFTIDPATGRLSFVTAPDYEAPGDSDQNRVYEVVVEASDGTSSASQALAISLANVNDIAPVITSNGGGAAASLSVAEDVSAVTIVTAADADGTTPTYAIAGGADAALFIMDPVTGALSFRSPPDFENRLDADADGVYQVSVRATDGINVANQLLSITVTDVVETGKTITGSSGNNAINPTTTVLGYQTTALNDTIFALAGNDIIDGGAGADFMDGGSGADTFYVDTYSDDGFAGNDDQVIELAGGGTDLVYASVSYRLAAQVENLTLTGAAPLNGIGNELANVLTGNDASNRLEGGLGNDTLHGNAGADALEGGDGADKLYGGLDADTLIGGVGDDLLDGGSGVDSMSGGTGNDTYYVDTWSDDGNAANDDQVTELAGGGTVDHVFASISYTLGAELERLTLAGTGTIDGRGNGLGNVITGNGVNNMLWGGLGDDTLSGNAGDDGLFGEDGLDTLDGGAGNDRLEGGAGVDNLQGKAGNDTLIGGAGKDTLAGGTEADTFVFSFGHTSLNSSSYDRITDFRLAEGDLIDLDFLNGSVGAGDYFEAAIATNNFADALAAARASATQGDVAFIAGTTDGWVFYDANGDGALDQAILLVGVNSVTGVDPTSFI
jgi:Ca2+-binding RTX toxin-like protein